MVDSSISDRILDERESAILRALVYEYILTGKAVGSRSFVQKYNFSISPATMRNVMSDLENFGYLQQPHTSAGRIPTDRGYRYYVDSLLENYSYSFNEDIELKEDILAREMRLDKIFDSITRMLSQASNYSGVMLTPRPDFAVVKRIELVPVDSNEILLILVARTGMVLTKKVFVSATLTPDSLYEYSRYLTAELCGYSIHEIREKIFEYLRGNPVQGFNTDMAIDIAELGLGDEEESELHVDGIENLLKIPEMVEEERLNSLLNIIEEKNIIRSILEDSLSTEGIRTFIGEEIENAKVSGCSMVTTSYKIGNRTVGVIGVIGPTRMDYKKVVPLVDYTGRIVSELLTRMSR